MRSIGEQPSSDLIQLGQSLIDYDDVFARHELDLGCLSKVKHVIDTGDASPVKQAMGRTPLACESEERAHLEKLLYSGVIVPSSSWWASAVVLVRKKDESVRWCIDYRALNDKTRNYLYPLRPTLIEGCLDALSGALYFSSVDMAQGYYQKELGGFPVKRLPT